MAKKSPFRAGRTLDALYENVEILTGQRGNGAYRAVTETDVSNIRGAVSRIVVGSGSGSGDSSIVEIPHAPQNVQAFGGFSAILVQWDNPTFQGYAYAEVWRSQSNNLSTAVLVGTTPATVFSDVVNTGSSYYYWIRFLNTNNQEGPYQDVNGVLAETSPDIANIIDDLAEQMRASALVQELQAGIDNSATQSALDDARSELETANANVANDLVAAKDALEHELALVDETLAQLGQGATETGASVSRIETILKNVSQTLALQIKQLNAAYKSRDYAQTTVTDAKITEVERVMADEDSALAERITALDAAYKSADTQTVASITALQQVVSDGDSALSKRVDDLDAAYKAADAATNSTISTLQQAVADEDSALSQRIDSLDAAYKSADAATNATLTALEQTVADEDSALSQRINNLDSAYKSADTATNATLTALHQTVASGDSALSQRIDSLDAAYKSADSATNASIAELEETVADEDAALSQRINNLDAAYKSADTATNATLTALQQTVASGDSALSQRIDGIDSAYKSADAATNASLTSLQQTVSNNNSSISSRVDTVEAKANTAQSTANSASAAAQTNSQAIATINSDGSVAYRAMWAAKAQAGDISAGIGILAGSGGVSQVAVSATQFFVFNPNGSGTLTPAFAVDNGQVIIPQAMIEKATIQILNAQTIVADQVVASINISTPAITGGMITGSVLRLGAGGPFNGYKVYVDSSGNMSMTGHVDATSGSIKNLTASNVVIDETCEVRGTLEANQIKGDIYTNIRVSKASTTSIWVNSSNNTRKYVIGSFEIESANIERLLRVPPVAWGSGGGNVYVWLRWTDADGVVNEQSVNRLYGDNGPVYVALPAEITERSIPCSFIMAGSLVGNVSGFTMTFNAQDLDLALFKNRTINI